MILYRYRSMECKQLEEMFTEQKIYAARPRQFNDPFDCRGGYIFDSDDKSSLRLLTQELNIARWKNYGIIEDLGQTFTDGISMSEFFEYMLNGMIDKYYGVVSLTEARDEILMWSHYSDSHKGFVLGFDREALEDSEAVFEIIDVEYGNFPTQKELVDAIYSNGIEISASRMFIRRKAEQWRYEKEWRLMTIRGDKNMYINYPKRALVEVIFGATMDDRNKEIILNLIKRSGLAPRFYQAYLSETDYKLDILPFNKD